MLYQLTDEKPTYIWQINEINIMTPNALENKQPVPPSYPGPLFETNNLPPWEREHVWVYIMIIYCNVYVEFVA